MKIDERKCFGARPDTGNLALVVQHGPAGIAQRQAFAAEARRPACVFLTEIGGGRFEADFYYPHSRSPLCLHASLAAAHVLFEQAGEVMLLTAMQRQPLLLARSADTVLVGVEPQPVTGIAIAPGLPAELMGQEDLALASVPVVASVGSPKLLIEVSEPARLHALSPALDKVVAWGKTHGVNGCYVYCRVGEHEFVGRNFNHLDPALEDSATGVAAGALTAHLGHGLILHQGKSSENDCRIVTRVNGATIFVGGNVTR